MAVLSKGLHRSKIVGKRILDPNDNIFRVRRFERFASLVQEIVNERGAAHILDIGGTASYWRAYGRSLLSDGVRVTLLNLNLEQSHRHTPYITAVEGDARNVRQFADHTFDIVHSNSVIEHVGRWKDMEAMAKEVRRLAPRYFVQTPYYWFPVEPHAQLPFFHWLPECWRYRIVMQRQWGFWPRCETVNAAMRQIEGALLLDKRQMVALFPDAEIWVERFCGLPKSLVAIRS